MVDLDAYFTRIGYEGPRNNSVATLAALHALHPAAIPFESLDPLLGLPVPLDIEALQAKLVARRRGGYCFEQNTLFSAVLKELGFRVTGLAARVVMILPPDGSPNPRTHMLLLVETAEGPMIADVGFGGLLASAPLRLEAGLEQDTPSGRARFVRTDDGFMLQAWTPPIWRDLYRFTLDPQFPVDFQMGNWFTATFPDSLFRHNLLMERLMPTHRISLFNRRVTRRYPDGRVEQTTLPNAAALVAVLRDDFAIDPPADPATWFARLPAE